MKLFTCKQIKQIDSATIINEPILSVDLMERASGKVVDWLINRFPDNTSFLVLAGPGNNGGDGLAVARMLCNKGYKADALIVNLSENYAPDMVINMNRLAHLLHKPVSIVKSVADMPTLLPDMVVIDAIFGSGLSRPVTGFASEIIALINAAQSCVVSIDIPSGLFGEDNSLNNGAIVKADVTLSFEFPKLTFMFPASEQYVGDMVVLPIGLNEEAVKETSTPFYYVDDIRLVVPLKQRLKFSHKGSYGHALLVGGSLGKMGAVILGSKAALKTGAGLVSCRIPSSGNDILQIAVPEVMVNNDISDDILTSIPALESYSAVGIGPGMGTSTKSFNVVHDLIVRSQVPIVVDADALNIMSLNKEWLAQLPENSIITPHPKEFERLVGKWNDDYQRLQKQVQFSIEYKCIVVLKGANTSITSPKGDVWFNSTGNPGMATAGSGDVLTGIILSLLAQGYKPLDAALLGVYLHGLAGDFAADEICLQSLMASDIIDNIWQAYNYILSE